MDFIPQEDKQAYYQQLYKRVNQPGYFSAQCNILVTKLDDLYAEGELTVTRASMNPQNIVHGGALYTLMDAVSGIAAITCGRACVTLNSSASFLRPGRDTEKIYCVSSPVKVGRTIAVLRAVLTDDAGQELANGTFTYFVLDRPL
ncbi:MAG: PaaI family thioesterase [Oscillospiraceae bacterium]|nr:PaaI family thioesterase [Oscillospiraceae bacterium]